MGAPLGLIIFATVLAAGLLTFITAVNPMTFAIGVIPALLGVTLVISCYLWLDRWEPEPRRLLIYAFVWGGGFATVFALGIGFGFASLGFLSGPVTTIVVQAPLVEEFAKGMFVWLMLTGIRRKELSTLTDCLVYAGFVGIGFGFVEDLLYFSTQTSLTGTLVTIVVRLALGVFAHPLFTTMTAIGVYVSMQRKTAAGRTVALLGGYLGAVVLHGIWDGSTVFGLAGYLLAYAGVMVPVFVGVIVLASLSRKHEGRMLNLQLPAMVQAQLIGPAEASWLSALGNRRRRRLAAKRAGGKPAVKQVQRFTDAVTELAFLQDRIDRGLGTPKTAQLHQELMQAVSAERLVAAPHLNQITAPRPPMPGGPQPPAPPASYNPIPGGPIPGGP